jgi:nucleoside-diphosphate-sugar epimerase
MLTGARGYLGQACMRLLTGKGHEVHAITRAEAPPRVPGAIWHHGDLLARGTGPSLARTIRPSHLLHLAWCTTHGHFWRDPDNLDWVGRSLELVRETAEQGGQRIVWAGSCAEYDWASPPPYREATTPLRPATLYGACKHAMATAMEAYLGQEQVDHGSGRIFFTFGPGEPATRLVPSVIRSLLAGRRPHLADGAKRRDFLYVDDVASALVALVEKPVLGAVNIGSGQAPTIREVAVAISRILEREDLVDCEAPTGRSDTPDVLVADTTRLREEVGWTPTYNLSMGLERTIEYWANEAHT